MLMPGRKYSVANTNYRYGFNGKEKSDEINGSGVDYDYGARILDARLGRFLSQDPLQNEYPFYTPYQFSSNTPIFSVDIDGLEADKILNKAESLLYTPYEFGGKNPAPDLIGSLATPEGKSFWITTLRPKLQLISDFHPDHYKNRNGIVLTYAEKTRIWQSVVSDVYHQFSTLSKKGSLGIDCSGFVSVSYLQDKELLFDPKGLRTGSGGQLAVFLKAAKEDKAYVHNNFNLISAGDFIKKPGHVMIATGNVKVDSKGNVVEFETYEANSTNKGSITLWRKPNSSYTIGHPFRTSDVGSKKTLFKIFGKEFFYHELIPSLNPETRTKDNMHQTIIRDEKNNK